MSGIRREVLNIFKKLHRTRQIVFNGDQYALTEARNQINENFRKNQNVTDEKEIKRIIQLAYDVEKELRMNVIQAVEKEEDLYELHIREETPRLDNVLFNPDAKIERPQRRRKNGDATSDSCCGEATPKSDEKEVQPQ